MPRPSNTEARRAQIIDGLRRVMAERGYEKATVAAIARAAGLSPGLVHYHFASKDEVLLALVKQLEERLSARAARRVASTAAPRAKLHALLDAFVATGEDADRDGVACWVVVGTEALRREEVRTVYAAATRRALAALEARVAEVLEEEGRALEGAPAIAVALLSAIEGAFQLASTVPDVVPPGFAAGALGRMADGLLDGVGPAAPSTSTKARKEAAR